MKFVDEFRDQKLAQTLASAIQRQLVPGRTYNLMEFCGGHTHAIFRYGIHDLLPTEVNMVHGPGCPVCVLPAGCIDAAIALAKQPNVTLCTYGDMLRVPGHTPQSLSHAKAEGADVRMIYSCQDALRIAENNPGREVVFLAIGFETTTPPTAAVIKAASRKGLTNFSVYCNHVLTPAALDAILSVPEDRLALDGFVGPAHVSAIIGSGAYEPFAEKYGKPIVISGFEPLDMMEAIRLLIIQINDGRHVVENEYTRVVNRDGNRKAQALMDDVFERRDTFVWRGLGSIPDSALRIRDTYATYDAEKRFAIAPVTTEPETPCRCADVIRGRLKPNECPLFATACTPDHPVGACMVSAEGSCAAHYIYRRE